MQEFRKKAPRPQGPGDPVVPGRFWLAPGLTTPGASSQLPLLPPGDDNRAPLSWPAGIAKALSSKTGPATLGGEGTLRVHLPLLSSRQPRRDRPVRLAGERPFPFLNLWRPPSSSSFFCWVEPGPMVVTPPFPLGISLLLLALPQWVSARRSKVSSADSAIAGVPPALFCRHLVEMKHEKPISIQGKKVRGAMGEYPVVYSRVCV